MIYVIHGTDIDKARDKARALFEALREKKPDASAGTLNAEDITPEKLEELTQTQGLFENKQIIFMNRTLENKDMREIVIEKITEIAESPNIFIFFEGKLTKEVLKKLEKKAEKITEYELDEKAVATAAAEAKTEKSSFFVLADAFANRDKKNMWLLVREALDKDAVPEELHGILFWQAKNMLIASRALSPMESGLNAFVYSKAKKALVNFKEGEMDAIVSDLVHMYHRAHRGQVDFEIELEKFALDI